MGNGARGGGEQWGGSSGLVVVASCGVGSLAFVPWPRMRRRAGKQQNQPNTDVDSWEIGSNCATDNASCSSWNRLLRRARGWMPPRRPSSWSPCRLLAHAFGTAFVDHDNVNDSLRSQHLPTCPRARQLPPRPPRRVQGVCARLPQVHEGECQPDNQVPAAGAAVPGLQNGNVCTAAESTMYALTVRCLPTSLRCDPVSASARGGRYTSWAPL